MENRVSVNSFARAYETALREHADLCGDDGLAPAYELGRRAVEERLSLLDLAGIHGDALVGALRSGDPEDREPIARRGADFLREGLSTFEITLRGYTEMREVARVEREHVLELREIADTLQRSLLPSALPVLEGLELAARFCPAGDGVMVGGDFYDAFALEERGSSGAVIGDVCGKGPAAAALTALVRHTLRAALLVGATSPAGVLGLVNAAIRQQARGELCTVLLGLLDRRPEGCAVRFATGGHPLPIVIPAAGAIHGVGEPGMLLGASDEPVFSTFEISLGRDDLLVFYTDGVIEVRGGGRELFGLDDLLGVLEECRGVSAQEVADRVADAALSATDGPARDDIAVLALRVGS
jgi:serine phosphatase RsbU (regulator of sigma subunit)